MCNVISSLFAHVDKYIIGGDGVNEADSALNSLIFTHIPGSEVRRPKMKRTQHDVDKNKPPSRGDIVTFLQADLIWLFLCFTLYLLLIFPRDSRVPQDMMDVCVCAGFISIFFGIACCACESSDFSGKNPSRPCYPPRRQFDSTDSAPSKRRSRRGVSARHRELHRLTEISSHTPFGEMKLR